MHALGTIRERTGYEFIMVTNQDGRGTTANPGCKALKIGGEMTWEKITEILVAGERRAECRRTTRETDIAIAVELDRPGQCDIATGLPFFDHMLAQIAHHGGMGLSVQVKGDLEVDAHHTVEDTALALGDCLRRALGDKLGISRYGYCLPMDDCLVLPGSKGTL